MDRIDELVKDAYVAPEATTRLGDRLNVLAAQAPPPRRRSLRLFKTLLLGLALLAVLGFAYSVLFVRRGEAAIALIPSDASVVVTLDLVPSEGQVPVFKRIGDALKREGLDQKLPMLLSKNNHELNDEVVRKVQPYLLHNMAFAHWGGSVEQDLLLLPVSDAAAVKSILAAEGTPEPSLAGTYQFAGPGNKPCFAGIIGEYLAIGTSTQVLRRVEQTEAGDEPSVSRLAAYQEARGALPADANLMVFMSPDALAFDRGDTMLRAAKWASFGASVRDNGIRFDFRGPVEDRLLPGLRQLGNKPIDRSVFRALPTGALAALVDADLSGYYRWMAQSQDAKAISNGIRGFEKESGLSVERDILPAFQGDVAVALYPGATQKPEDMNVLLLVDTSYGGTPAELADKVQALVQKESSKDHPVQFQKAAFMGADVWSLAGPTAVELQKSLKEEVGSGHEFVYATLNGSVLLASNRALLYSAIRCTKGNATLADDPGFNGMIAELADKDSGAFMISLHRVMEHCRPWLAKINESGKGVPTDQLVGLFGATDGLVISGHMDGQMATAHAFLPLDYDKAAHFLAVSAEDN